ncbi:hypothetical protein GCM10010174_30290 [Kutzneria viridogrisea]
MAHPYLRLLALGECIQVGARPWGKWRGLTPLPTDRTTESISTLARMGEVEVTQSKACDVNGLAKSTG